MSLIAIRNPPPIKVAEAEVLPSLPELDDVDYFLKVLQLPPGKTDRLFDDELEAKASSLGIEITHPVDDKRMTTSAESASSTVATYHARTFSTGSDVSTNTALTATSLLDLPESEQASADTNLKGRSKNLSFAQYDKYLSQISPVLEKPRIRKGTLTAANPDNSAQSLFSVRTRRSIASVKSSISRRIRWRRKSFSPMELPTSCICCRDDFDRSAALHHLPCGHTYCTSCLRVMVSQAVADEAKMPPRCCTTAVPTSTVRAVLERPAQQAFLKAVVQFSTPWESRIFCPNPACGEFVPPRNKIDPKHPFDVTCRRCRSRVCTMCKRDAHPVGKDCPADIELEDVLKMGEKSGWRRCYKCKNLVELTQGCSHMTCRCKAQFCYVCGGVWDSAIGCPNFCNGEEELERRRIEEEERLAKLEAEKAAQEAAAAVEAAERAEAEQRSRGHAAFQSLEKTQEEDLERFQDFISKAKASMRARQTHDREALIEKNKDQEEKMKERHAKTASHLEDRQIAAEMELRASLEQSERSVRIRLKHMEAYCDGLGRMGNSHMPHRVVTERDLRELGQQYNLRDNMERLNQSKINVMRDRQAKRMEELIERQEMELTKLETKRQEDLETLGAQFAHEEDILGNVFKTRQNKLRRRWELAIEILVKELEVREGETYAQIPTPKWPDETTATEDTLVEESGE